MRNQVPVVHFFEGQRFRRQTRGGVRGTKTSTESHLNTVITFSTKRRHTASHPHGVRGGLHKEAAARGNELQLLPLKSSHGMEATEKASLDIPVIQENKCTLISK